MRPTPRAVVTRGELRPGDLLAFATDATAQRLLAEVESGTPPDWGRFWDLDQETWRREIEAIRDRDAIVNDDCTLVVLRLPGQGPAGPVATEPEPAGESSPRRLDFAETPRAETSVEPPILAPESEPETQADPASQADAAIEAGWAYEGIQDSPTELLPPAGGAS